MSAMVTVPAGALLGEAAAAVAACVLACCCMSLISFSDASAADIDLAVFAGA